MYAEFSMSACSPTPACVNIIVIQKDLCECFVALKIQHCVSVKHCCETHSRDLGYGTKSCSVSGKGNAVSDADIRPGAMFP